MSPQRSDPPGGLLPLLPTRDAFDLEGGQLWRRRSGACRPLGDMVAGAASHCCFDHTSFGGIVIPTLGWAASRTPKGLKEKRNDR
jgi:hypothetical protein